MPVWELRNCGKAVENLFFGAFLGMQTNTLKIFFEEFLGTQPNT